VRTRTMAAQQNYANRIRSKMYNRLGSCPHETKHKTKFNLMVREDTNHGNITRQWQQRVRSKIYNRIGSCPHETKYKTKFNLMVREDTNHGSTTKPW